MLGARKELKSEKVSSASENLANGTGVWIAAGADDPGADAWPMWQIWHCASPEAVLWKCVTACVASATTANTVATTSRR